MVGATAQDGANLAFIVGQRKSGSTWLLTLLSLHPDIRGLHETSIFAIAQQEPDPRARTKRLFASTPWSRGGIRHLPWYRLRDALERRRFYLRSHLHLQRQDRPESLLDLPIRQQLTLRRHLLQTRAERDYCHQFFADLAGFLAPRGYLLEKSTSHIHHLDVIRGHFPDSKLLVIHRDGRDVVVSERFFARVYERRDPAFARSVLNWRRTVEAELSLAARHSIFRCSYENLHRDGPRVVAALLEYLDLPADAPVISDLLDRSSFRFRTGREPGEERRDRFLRKGIVGDWQNHFTPEHKMIFKDLAGDMLVTLGYERDLDW